MILNLRKINKKRYIALRSLSIYPSNGIEIEKRIFPETSPLNNINFKN